MSRVIAASAESKLDTASSASNRALDYRRARRPRIKEARTWASPVARRCPQGRGERPAPRL